MNFDLRRPCPNCPFLTDCLPGWLGKTRAAEIASGLDAGSTFTCHKTTGDKGGEQHCAGALILLKKEQGGFSGMIAVACALGLLDYKTLDLNAPVFASFSEFIAHHDSSETI